MGFRRLATAAVGQVLVLGCGAGAVAAWGGGLYASATVLTLAGGWAGAVLAWRAARPPYRTPRPAVLAVDPLAAESERRLLASLVDQTPAPLLMLHGDGRLQAGNRAARGLFRVDDHLPDPPEALCAAIRESEPGERRTVRLDTPAGGRAFTLSVADVVGPRGPVRLAAMVDIQPEIHAAEASALRDLLSILSHEIMNSLTPVASLAGTAEALLREETSEPAMMAHDAVATLARRADGLTRFVQAYRTLARLPPPRLAAVSVGLLLEETARLFEGRWKRDAVRLDWARPRPDIIAKLDADLVMQALLNLLSNGAEAALEGGAAEPAVRLAAEAAPGVLSLVVQDNGPGVPDEVRENVFRPFFTTKAKGTGVGLSLARQVALSHGGDLVLEPAGAAGGARFVLQL